MCTGEITCNELWLQSHQIQCDSSTVAFYQHQLSPSPSVPVCSRTNPFSLSLSLSLSFSLSLSPSPLPLSTFEHTCIGFSAFQKLTYKSQLDKAYSTLLCSGVWKSAYICTMNQNGCGLSDGVVNTIMMKQF